MHSLKAVLKDCESRGMADSVEAAKAAQRRAESRRTVLKFVAALEDIVDMLEPKIQRMCARAEQSGDYSECEDVVQYLEDQIGEESRRCLYTLIDSFGCRLPDYARFLALRDERAIREVAAFAINDLDEDVEQSHTSS